MFNPALIGTACVMLGSGLVGSYDKDGYCVVSMGTNYARPANSYDINSHPQDQHDLSIWKLNK